jgi:hypothetical protein
MPELGQATCVYHPAKDAVSKCRQCGQTTCHECTVTGPTGKFCSTPCRTAHEAKTLQHGDVEGKAGSSFSVRLRGMLRLVIFIVVVFACAAFATKFVYIPGLSEIITKILTVLGI